MLPDPTDIQPIAVYGVTDDGRCRCKIRGCKSPGKHPIGVDWTTNPRLPGRTDNVGFRTGRDGGFWVLDVDIGKGGRESLTTLLAGRKFPKTRMVVTGSGGLHVYFKYPSDGKIRNSASKIAPGIDVRGDGGFVVAPPSRHVSGGSYTYKNEFEINDAPDWLLRKVWTEEDRTYDAPVIDIAPERRLRRAQEYLSTMPGAVEGQGGDEQTFKAASVGYQFGVDEALWAQYLIDNYNPRCVPPWDEDDLIKKVENAYTYTDRPSGWKLGEGNRESEDDPEPYKIVLTVDGTSDVDLAKAWIKHYSDGARIIGDDFWTFDRGAWAPSKDFRSRIIADLHGSQMYVARNRDEQKRLGLSISQATSIEDALTALMPNHSFDDYWKTVVPGVGTTDGVVEISEDGLSMRDPDQDRPVVNVVDVAYVPDARCPGFLEYLSEVWEGCDDLIDRIRFFGEFLGAAVCGQATKYDKMLLLTGSGNNGKSTLMKSLGPILFHADGTTALEPQAFKDSKARKQLHGAVWNYVDELPGTGIIESSSIKSIVSGGLMSAHKMYHGPVSFRPVAAHVYNVNNLPTVADLSAGFWRRVAVLDFPHSFVEDVNVKERYERVFKDESSGILNFALGGMWRLLRKGTYTEYESGIMNRERWNRNSDTVARFANDALVPGEFTRFEDVWDAYCLWFEQESGSQKGPNVHRNTFAQRLTKCGYPSIVNGYKVRGRACKLKPKTQWDVDE